MIDYCKRTGIVLLSFPPHCSHKLQALHQSAYGPFKRYYNSASADHIRTHLGKSLTIYSLLQIVKECKRIQKGFLYPKYFHRTETSSLMRKEFLRNYTIDRPIPKKPSRSGLPNGNISFAESHVMNVADISSASLSKKLSRVAKIESDHNDIILVEMGPNLIRRKRN